MIQTVEYPYLQTLIFAIPFLIVLLLSARWEKSHAIFPITQTNELKGIALLGIVFSHIGYFLIPDHLFLWPFSIIAGVGVNIFLLLSGYGLTVSRFRKTLSVLDFYKKRLRKLFIPMWIVITAFIVIDFLMYRQTYSPVLLFKNYLGFFPEASNIRWGLDTPLWYFSLIIFYYLLFPLVTVGSLVYFAPILILLVSFVLTEFNLLTPFIHMDIINLYKAHLWAFPIGVAIALIANQKIHLRLKEKFNHWSYEILRLLIVLLGLWAFSYLAVHSFVGADIKLEQATSLLTIFVLLIVFVFKRVEFKLLEFFGNYSYEIYLFHLPLLFRYDYLYPNLPWGIATLIYLIIFLGLAMGLRYLDETVDKIISKAKN